MWPPLPILSLRFAEWVARYTLSQLGMVVRMMMGPPNVFEPGKPRFGVTCNTDARGPTRMTTARKRAIEIAARTSAAPGPGGRPTRKPIQVRPVMTMSAPEPAV